jgi:phytoene/squalene synthetase
MKAMPATPSACRVWLSTGTNSTGSNAASPGRRSFQGTGAIIAEWRLPLVLFRDLLDAFAQDVVKKRYADYPELLDYCRRSANPVGRLLLHLVGRTSAENLQPLGLHLFRRCN